MLLLRKGKMCSNGGEGYLLVLGLVGVIKFYCLGLGIFEDQRMFECFFLKRPRGSLLGYDCDT